MIAYFCISCISSFLIYSSDAEFVLEEGEFEEIAEELILREGQKIQLKEFIDEPQFIQKINYVNKISTYILKSENEDEDIVYRRKSMDKGKVGIVLHSSEDGFPLFPKKRTFVYLKQNLLSNKTYFASYVYVRYKSNVRKFKRFLKFII